MGNAATGVGNAFKSLGAWLSQPYKQNMNTLDWFLFGGLVLVILGIWLMILRDLKGAIE